MSKIILAFNEGSDPIKKWLLIIIRFFCFAILLTPLIIFRNAYFPYIVPKTLYFRIIVDIICLLYLWLVWRDRSFLPKKSWVSWSLLFYYVVLIVATIASTNPVRSFWSTWERMDGTFTLLHVLAFVLILVHVFKEEKWWRRLFIWQMVLAVVMYGYSLAQRAGASFTFESGVDRANGTLGNSAYLAAYSLFNFFLAVWLFWMQKKSTWRWLYVVMAAVSLVILVITKTRGAQLGLFITLAILVIAAFILGGRKSRPIRLFMIVGAVLVMFWVALFIFRNSSFVKEHSYFSRVVSISTQEATLQTRLFSWRGGLREFPHYWLTGVGPENYHYIFNKEFDPKFLNYSPNEVWFDRAHNMVVEMALTRGLFGLISYLALFAAVIGVLWSLYKKKIVDLITLLMFSGLFISYFLQNFTVFDALASYLLFFVFLGYVYHLENDSHAAPQLKPEELKKSFFGQKLFRVYLFNVAIIVLLIAVIWSFFQNVKQISGNQEIIKSFLSGGKDYAETLDHYRQALAIGEPRTEIKILWMNYLLNLSNQILNDNRVDPKFRQQYQEDFKEALTSLEASSAEEWNSLFVYFILSRSYLTYINISHDALLVNRAEEVIQHAIDLSPRNLRPWYVLAELRTMQNRGAEALEIFKKVADWNPDYLDARVTLMIAYWQNQRPDLAKQQADFLLDKKYDWQNLNQLTAILPVYEQLQDWPHLATIYQILVKKQAEEKQWLVKLANSYTKLGKTDEAAAVLKGTK